ncbi:hypothetical protein K493DRAFT_346244 [Basidiobolus meristosporus CBS 931.73]|uniref:RGS domain-containing protein n=1 Tax=Basidiobolus meristosporus CBS 931.73 TaxID=1314790 RepID=A0A1Y1YZ12_9FUNG|nr:hypothetical protein K493DRAFT_346244 [Basidiobolus meristosporus CBS 931.73]|eukprot:ORY03261.1 hypothetical protein K493DRAFT_346244 [Basidiobolus meristosporus CBS 931.73]
MSLKTATPRSPRIPCEIGFPPNLVQKNSNKPSCRHSVLPDLGLSEDSQQGAVAHLNPFSRQARRLRIQAARNQRAFEHIESYIRVTAFVSLNHYFPVTVSRSSTVEELSRLIEAEYAFNYLCTPTLAGSLDCVRESTQSLKQLLDKELMEDLTESELLGPEHVLEEDEGNVKPLICGAIFLGKEELRFSDSVGDVLDKDDIIRAVNIYEEMALMNEAGGIGHSDPRRWSSPLDHVRPDGTFLDEIRIDMPLAAQHANTIPLREPASNSAEVRFQNIFHNKICLNYFRQFCLQEHCIESLLFWVEVEVYRSTKSSLVLVIAEYLYRVYIDSDGPLRINIPEEIRSTILLPAQSPEYLPNLTMFDEAQEYVFDLLVHHVLPQFEASELYVKLVNDQAVDRANFEQAYISESITKWLQFDIGTVANVMDTISKYHENQLDMHNAAQERDHILESVMNQMFTHIPMRPYFTKSRLGSNGQSPKGALLKKRLAKLMGRRSAEKESIQRIINELLPFQRIPMEDLERSHDPIPSINAEGIVKKKKIERLGKLEDFFGKKLSSTQLAHQNLVNPEDDFDTRNSHETVEPFPLYPLTTYNDLSPEERRLLAKRTRKLKLLFGEPMDEQLVSKSLTNPIIANKLASATTQNPDESYKPIGSEPEELEKDLTTQELCVKSNSKEIKRKKLIKLHQLLGVYPSPNQIDKGSSPNKQCQESMIQRNVKTAPPEVRKLQVKRANKLEKVFGHHPPKEFIKVNKETEIPLQKRTSIVSYLLDSESSVEDLMHYLKLLSTIKDKPAAAGASPEDASDSCEELSEDENSQVCDGQNKATRQKKLSKLRRFFGNDLGLESLITQNILLRQQLVAESLYNIDQENELFGQHLNNLGLTEDEASEEYVRQAMKTDYEQLRQEVQDLHRLDSHDCSRSNFIKRVVRTASISGTNTLRPLRTDTRSAINYPTK